MDDQTLDMLSEEFQRIALSSAKKAAAVAASAASKSGCEQVEEILDSTNENGDDNSTREFTPEQDQTLPILQKVINLSTKLQDLKKDHAVLFDEMRGLSAPCIVDPEVVEMLEKIRKENETLKRRCLGESLERKRLYNEVIELKGNIRVFCRCRPLNSMELTNGIASVVEIGPSQENELQINCADSSKKQFRFDHVFGPDDSQEAVFAQTKPVVCSVLDGYNVCIFAYGQTGTGKTFTMEGTTENRGVNYRTLEELFRLSEERSGIMNYEISVSMLEVYNEKLRDLLVENSDQNAKKLEIKQAADGTQEVPGLVEPRVFSTEEVWERLKSGSRARSVGSTSANELSSRSHCLLRVTVKGENVINGQRTRSHLWMVDLAGSERVGRIEVEGERLKESQYINKSLSALGDVISALASKTAHIPYRNSKLTHLLQSSLGGDCKTLMFVQVSPSATDLGETLCSLNFATRVRGVESGPARKQADVSELFKYKQMVEKLKHDEKETKKLQDGMQSLQLRLAAREHACRCLQEKVRDLEQQLAEERKMRLKQETKQRISAASSLPTVKEASYRTLVEKSKPPLAPSRLRMPLRRITNIMPSSSSHKSSFSFNKGSSAKEKENTLKSTASTGNTKTMFQPRRISIAARPTPSTKQTLQPRRRVSIATFHPESSLHMATPVNASTRLKTGDMMGRQSFVKDPRKARYSRLFSPVLKSALETTPVAMRSSSSKFMGSPVAQVGSWKPRHPTVVALQRKSLVWSPLKLKNLKSTNKPS